MRIIPPVSEEDEIEELEIIKQQAKQQQVDEVKPSGGVHRKDSFHSDEVNMIMELFDGKFIE